MLTVLKPFPHPIRRFAVGQEITEAELAGCVIPLADLKKGRFVAGADTKAAEAAAEKAEASDEPVIEMLPIPEGATQLQVAAIIADRDAGKKGKTA